MDYLLNNRRVVLLDCDGTLLDSMRGFFTITQASLSKRGVKFSEEMKVNIGNDILSATQSESSKMKRWTIPKLFWMVARKSGLSVGKSILFLFDVLPKLKSVYLSSKPFNDVEEGLNNLKNQNFNLALFSMASRSQIDLIFEKKLIKIDFEIIVTRNDVIKGKPDPEGVYKILDYFNTVPTVNNAIMVGDMPVDIISAQKADISTIALTTGLLDKNQILALCQPNIVLNSFNEAVEYIIHEWGKSENE